MKTCRYSPSMADVWDNGVRKSRNATFLFERGFMDYHQDRFEDISLMFFDRRDNLCGLLPANLRRDADCVESHGGLTYGGLLLAPRTSLEQTARMLHEAAAVFRDCGVRRLIYKPTPYIYNVYPAEEPLYWLFRSDARLVARSVSATIDLTAALPYSALRRRRLKLATRTGWQLDDSCTPDRLAVFWEVLTAVLRERHNAAPVHSLGEMTLLAGRFPRQISLHTVCDGARVVAGCVVFFARPTAHVQYIAADSEGRESGALELLFHSLRSTVADAGFRYLDFGISTELGGMHLNTGLAFQKEGLGGRAVCYDTYSVELERLLAL